MDIDEAGQHRKLQIDELEKIRNETYNNAKIYKNELRYFMIEQSLENYFYLVKKFFCITLGYIYFLKNLDLDGQSPI